MDNKRKRLTIRVNEGEENETKNVTAINKENMSTK